ncbi:hypothetical protein [Cupriavidus necator]|uniref:hypothetical protein n=1 Tax=Cupriavidus necator TaxID=106590 RepID=UPI00339D70C7
MSDYRGGTAGGTVLPGVIRVSGDLYAWTAALHEYALEAGLISWEYVPDYRTLERLRLYFRSGLTPGEAARACFMPC